MYFLSRKEREQKMEKHLNKKAIFIIGFTVMFCMTVFMLVKAIEVSPAKQLNEQLSLGEKYLSELNYESAIVTYTAAIAIDPKCEEAYIQLAEVYIATGDAAKALQVLEEGYQQTASEVIQAKIIELKESMTEAHVGNTQERIEIVQKSTEAENSESEPEFIDHVMDWKDENLEAAMREITGITDRDIMLSDVWNKTELKLENKKIENITALGGLKNVEVLYLSNNFIVDISSLKEMKNIKELKLENNYVNGISALSELVSLEL